MLRSSSRHLLDPLPATPVKALNEAIWASRRLRKPHPRLVLEGIPHYCLELPGRRRGWMCGFRPKLQFLSWAWISKRTPMWWCQPALHAEGSHSSEVPPVFTSSSYHHNILSVLPQVTMSFSNRQVNLFSNPKHQTVGGYRTQNWNNRRKDFWPQVIPKLRFINCPANCIWKELSHISHCRRQGRQQRIVNKHLDMVAGWVVAKVVPLMDACAGWACHHLLNWNLMWKIEELLKQKKHLQ